MNRTFFEETQTYRQARWILTIVFSSSAFVAGLLIYGVYVQLIMGVPWGDKPASNSGLIIAAIFSMGVLGLVIWLLLSIKLEVKIGDDQIQYRFFPYIRKWVILTPDRIESFEVKKLGIFERGKSGYRGVFTDNKKLIVLGRMALKVKTTDGNKVVIGTQSPEQLDWAMRKFMGKQEPGL